MPVILVVDDEPLLLDMLCEMLAELAVRLSALTAP
jgi:CheY-like chemotaxis protein